MKNYLNFRKNIVFAIKARYKIAFQIIIGVVQYRYGNSNDIKKIEN